MTTEQTAEALVAWVLEVVPEMQGSYDHPTDRKDQPLPDVAVEFESIEIGGGDEFSEFDIQQVAMRVRRANVLLMVDTEPAEAASDQLTDFIDRLMENGLSDRTLGGRVLRVSATMRASMTPPFVEFDDGTKGRLATLTIAVADVVEIDE